MTHDAQQSLTPRLRFPEFRKSSKEVHLRDLADAVSDRVGTMPCTPYTVTSAIGLVSQAEKFGRTIAGKSLKNYIRLQKNDFAYNKSATKAFPEGYIGRYLDDAKAAVPNSIFTCFRVDDGKIDPAYLDFLFAGNLHGRWLRKFLTTGARAHGSLNVSDDDLMALPVPMPSGSASFQEQHKIADCLTSLDELIAAQGRRVEALKAHKKGLMQQLFPREGETLPRLRFPEFRNAPEWVEKAIGEVFKVTRGEVLAMPLVKDERTDDSPYPVYSSQTKNRGLAGYFSEYLYEDAITWTTDGANAGDVNYRPGRCLCTNVCGVLISDKGYANPCTAALINNVSRQHVSYVANPKLMNAVMAKLCIAFPSLAEQHRIADCLSALDARLAAETDKLAALKTHKRGLMQQLFPSPEGMA